VLTRTYPVSVSFSTFYDSTGFSYLSLSLSGLCCVFSSFLGFMWVLRRVSGRPRVINVDNGVTRTRTSDIVRYLIFSAPFPVTVSLFSLCPLCSPFPFPPHCKGSTPHHITPRFHHHHLQLVFIMCMTYFDFYDTFAFLSALYLLAHASIGRPSAFVRIIAGFLSPLTRHQFVRIAKKSAFCRLLWVTRISHI